MNFPAPHPAPPQVVYLGGPVLEAPKLVPVFFANDDPTYEASLTDFVNKVGATPYWTTATSEYGVGAATAVAPIMLTETAPALLDDSTIQTWLQGKLDGNDPAWPPPDANTLYVLHYPAGTVVTLQSAMGPAQTCVGIGGYHSSTTLDTNHGSMEVPYAVIPRCANFGPLKGLDAVTGAESHELIEAATDPLPQDETAYGQVDDAHIFWELALGGGEVGDMCAQFPKAFTKFTDLPDYEVQRTWSNMSALAGHDPCVPALPGTVYFNAAPVLPDNIAFPGFGTMKGVKIAIGDSKTIDVDLFSDGDTGGPFDVQAFDFNQLMGQPANLELSLDRDSGYNGEILHLTISPQAKGEFGANIFVLMSGQGGGAPPNWWIGLVGS